MILELLRRLGVSGGKSKIFEFTGPGTADLCVPERGTIANMIAELGATAARLPRRRETRASGWRSSSARTTSPSCGRDTGATTTSVEIDLAELAPLVAKPQNPDNVVPVEEVAGTPIEQVCIGSSVNSGVLRPGAARRGPRDGNQLAQNLVSATATPGSRQILDPITRVGRLPPAGRGRRADARAGLRAVRRHGPGAAVATRTRCATSAPRVWL